MTIKYGMHIRLRHFTTSRLLKSLDKRFPPPSISRQQMALATNDETDAGAIWRVKGPHGTSEGAFKGKPVKNGAVVRLEHLNTRTNLHSHPLEQHHRAPVTRDGMQQEVTTHGALGVGDSNDDWILETQGTTHWKSGTNVRLIHQGTNRGLHSHEVSHPVMTDGFQEVTAYIGRDDSDFWQATQLEKTATAIVSKVSQQRRVQYVKKLLAAFPECSGYALRGRRKPILRLTAERSVQDLVFLMLRAGISDLKPEHPIAGANRRYAIEDFRSPSLKIVIEVKITRSRAHARRGLIEELNDDIGKYKADPACKDLIFFIYDPSRFVEAPKALKKSVVGKHRHGNRRIAVHCIIER
jgi:hypothetical protein